MASSRLLCSAAAVCLLLAVLAGCTSKPSTPATATPAAVDPSPTLPTQVASLPPAASNVKVVSTGRTNATMSWTVGGTQDGITSFIEYGTENRFDLRSQVKAGPGTHKVTLEGLDPSTPYQARIVVLVGLETASRSPLAYTFRTDVPLPFTPPAIVITNLTVESILEDHATVTWEIAGGAGTIASLIEYGAGDGFGLQTELNKGSGTFRVLLAGLNAGSLYHLRIRGVGAGGPAFSDTILFRTPILDHSIDQGAGDDSPGGSDSGPTGPDTQAPLIGVPEVTGSSAATVTLGYTVDDNSGSAQSFVAYSTDLSFGLTTTPKSGLGTQSVFVFGLDPSTVYNYRIVAYDAAGNTVYGTPQTFETQCSGTDNEPPAITNVAAGVPGIHEIQVGWSVDDACSVPTSAVEYARATQGFGVASQFTPSVLSNGVSEAPLSSLRASTSYVYRVIASDSAGNNAVSGTKTFTTGAAAPPPVIAVRLASLIAGATRTPNTPSVGGDIVLAGDPDVASSMLVQIPHLTFADDGDSVFEAGEGVYLDNDNSHKVSSADVRLTAVSGKDAGSRVHPFDADDNRTLIQAVGWSFVFHDTDSDGKVDTNEPVYATPSTGTLSVPAIRMRPSMGSLVGSIEPDVGSSIVGIPGAGLAYFDADGSLGFSLADTLVLHYGPAPGMTMAAGDLRMAAVGPFQDLQWAVSGDLSDVATVTYGTPSCSFNSRAIPPSVPPLFSLEGLPGDQPFCFHLAIADNTPPTPAVPRDAEVGYSSLGSPPGAIATMNSLVLAWSITGGAADVVSHIEFGTAAGTYPTSGQSHFGNGQFSEAFTSLTPNTLYHFRIVAESMGAGPASGVPLQVTTEDLAQRTAISRHVEILSTSAPSFTTLVGQIAANTPYQFDILNTDITGHIWELQRFNVTANKWESVDPPLVTPFLTSGSGSHAFSVAVVLPAGTYRQHCTIHAAMQEVFSVS